MTAAASPRPGLREVDPYQAPQLPVAARLNTNECPYPLPESFRHELAEAVRAITLNRYPDREATELREGLAAHAGHHVEGTWVANGSNEIIHQLLLAYAGPGRKVVLFEPTYVLHERLAWIAYGDVVRIRLGPTFVIGSRETDEALAAEPSVIFVCSPNNPTGNAQGVDFTSALASGSDALVVVDEAYIEFGGESAARLIADNPNVVVVRTFSKAFALAGARIGYCLATADLVDDLRRVRLPYHLSSLTQAAGLVALRYKKEAMSILEAVRRERERILGALPGLGVETFRSDANFVLFRPPRPAVEVWQRLLDRGVLVRDLTSVVPECLRVTAGTAEEVDLFLSAIEEALV
jgi:histidinol-phosphate aminotransferase